MCAGRDASFARVVLAELLERFVEAYPVEIDDLTILGHSMGGLVARSACHYGVEAGYAWPARVRRVFYLGTPHQGAPLGCQEVWDWANTYGLFLGRFHIVGSSIHSSATCLVIFAADLSDQQNPKPVALKLMHNEDEFQPLNLNQQKFWRKF